MYIRIELGDAGTFATDLSATLQNLEPCDAQVIAVRLISQIVRIDRLTGKPDEKTRVAEVHFQHHGDRKLEVIRMIRHHLGLPLKEAKDASESAPHIIFKDADQDKVKAFFKDLAACGADVKLKYSWERIAA